MAFAPHIVPSWDITSPEPGSDLTLYVDVSQDPSILERVKEMVADQNRDLSSFEPSLVVIISWHTIVSVETDHNVRDVLTARCNACPLRLANKVYMYHLPVPAASYSGIRDTKIRLKGFSSGGGWHGLPTKYYIRGRDRVLDQGGGGGGGAGLDINILLL